MNIGKNINGLYEKDVKKACIFFTERQKIKRIKNRFPCIKPPQKAKIETADTRVAESLPLA